MDFFRIFDSDNAKHKCITFLTGFYTKLLDYDFLVNKRAGGTSSSFFFFKLLKPVLLMLHLHILVMLLRNIQVNQICRQTILRGNQRNQSKVCLMNLFILETWLYKLYFSFQAKETCQVTPGMWLKTGGIQNLNELLGMINHLQIICKHAGRKKKSWDKSLYFLTLSPHSKKQVFSILENNGIYNTDKILDFP